MSGVLNLLGNESKDYIDASVQCIDKELLAQASIPIGRKRRDFQSFNVNTSLVAAS